MILYTEVYNGHIYVHILYINAHHIMGINSTLTSMEQSCTLKVHKRENFLGSDIEICTFS
jgi:hypothetical protein